MSFRLRKTRSPKVPFDAHLSVRAGGPKARGLYQVHQSESASGSSAHQPIQSRLQIASTISGRQLKRVQTLHGLACRVQAASSIDISRALPAKMSIPALLEFDENQAGTGTPFRKITLVPRSMTSQDSS